MPTDRRRVLLSWSSGKDSAWTLHSLRQDPRFEVVGLVTSTNGEAQRVAMHGVRQRLLQRQAEAVGLPLRVVPLPVGCSYEQYEDLYDEALVAARERDQVEVVAFGDLFLEDVRAYRERQALRAGLEPCFPLFGSDTRALARAMIDAGTRAHLTCVNPELCPAEFVGRLWDRALLDELPESVDPCGERGEFHTFVSASPALAGSIPVRVGEVVERGGVVFADLLEPDAPKS